MLTDLIGFPRDGRPAMRLANHTKQEWRPEDELKYGASAPVPAWVKAGVVAGSFVAKETPMIRKTWII